MPIHAHRKRGHLYAQRQQAMQCVWWQLRGHRFHLRGVLVSTLLNPHALVGLIASDPEALALLRSLIAQEHSVQAAGPYMTANEAADFLRCTRKRIYDLTSDGRLVRYGEGRRLLLKRSEVEALAHGSGV